MPVKESCEAWKLGFGAQVREEGGVEFGVWAPRVKRLEVRILGKQTRTIPLEPAADGEFRTIVPKVPAGSDYFYVVDGDRERPDPVSRSQPYGVHKASRVIDPSEFDWSDEVWSGIPLKDYLIYELHTGTFTREGTFEGVIPLLPYLRELGVTAVELMPVASFPGIQNWGYDGVNLYAPQSSYGGPRGLKKLVKACHRAGLAVVLDVVYNHLGPEGNYLNEFAPFFTQSYRTPWGDALNFDGPDSDGVRRFFVNNALYWLTEYHVDALRLDAIHGIFDFSARHIVEELTQSFHDQARILGRSAWIIAECDLDDVRVIRPKTLGGYGVDAQWHDDFHHALSTVLAGKNPGYLADFGRLEQLAKAIREGFVFDGQYSRYRRRRFGSSSADRPGEQFVSFIQNHDQIANACQGQRLASLVSLEQQKLAAVLLTLSPFLPLFFMGQEYGETAPFLYFTNFGDPALSRAVTEGRKKDIAAFGSDREFADPENAATFHRSKLDWECLDKPPHAQVLRLYRDLIALRKQHACLANCRKDLTTVEFNEGAKWLVIKRGDPAGSAVCVVCNFGPCTQVISTAFPEGSWQLALWTGAQQYGGSGQMAPAENVDVRQAPFAAEITGSASAVYLRQHRPPSQNS
jgi:maltooligosyltrehalose trehalohydrolase